MIEVQQLTKVYPKGRGIHGLSFQVEAGTAFGFLGPNGAGKTTTIRLLMGFMKPDQGSALIHGQDCWRDRESVKRRVGYLPGELHFMENLTGLEFLELIEGMHGERWGIKQKRKRLIQVLDLECRKTIRKMSKGMKQKLGLISALMLDAEVLIMDEPTSGLDPLMQKVFMELILEEKKKGTTIFMSSHQFQEIERTCERVGIIREGQLLSIQSIHELQQMEYRTFEIEVKSTEDAETIEESELEWTKVDVGFYRIRVAKDMGQLFQVLAKVQVKRFAQCSLELEDAFMQYYR